MPKYDNLKINARYNFDRLNKELDTIIGEGTWERTKKTGAVTGRRGGTTTGYRGVNNKVLRKTRAIGTLFGRGGAIKAASEIGTDAATRQAAVSATKAAAGRVLIGAAGKALSTGANLLFAYETGKLIAGGVANAIRNVVESIDANIGTLAGRGSQLEFGANVGGGFYGQGSVTDRQRAVQAISQSGFNGRRAVGSEAALGHVGNTW